MQKAALYTSGIFFTVGALAHLLRLSTGMEIVINGAVIPLSLSYLGVAIAALLAAWMFVAARQA